MHEIGVQDGPYACSWVIHRLINSVILTCVGYLLVDLIFTYLLFLVILTFVQLYWCTSWLLATILIWSIGDILIFCCYYPYFRNYSTIHFTSHVFSKGISQSALPYRRSVPTWLKLSSEDVKEQIFKLAKKGLTPSQIGKKKKSKIKYVTFRGGP